MGSSASSGESASTYASLPNYDPNDYINDTELEMNPMSYPNFGNYNLIQAPLKEIITWSIEKQMNLSDAICRRYAKNPLFQEKMKELMDKQESINVSLLNETSVGNAAFMAYHNPDSYWSKEYEKICQAIMAN